MTRTIRYRILFINSSEIFEATSRRTFMTHVRRAIEEGVRFSVDYVTETVPDPIVSPSFVTDENGQCWYE